MELVRILQLGDSMLPVGAFSFSNGLESAVQHRVVHDLTTLRQYVGTATRQAANADGIALLVAHRAALAGDDALVLAADRAVLIRKLNEEARSMTLRMGRKLVELADRLLATPRLGAWLALIRQGETPGTHPVALALALAEQGVGERDAFEVHQYGVATMMIGAALRLMRMSYLDGQSILYEVNGAVAEHYAHVRTSTLDDMATFSPVADILSACHLKARVRLFMG